MVRNTQAGLLYCRWCAPFKALEMNYCRSRICIQKTVTILLKFIVICSHNVVCCSDMLGQRKRFVQQEYRYTNCDQKVG